MLCAISHTRDFGSNLAYTVMTVSVAVLFDFLTLILTNRPPRLRAYYLSVRPTLTDSVYSMYVYDHLGFPPGMF